jgi:hypothetical protein
MTKSDRQAKKKRRAVTPAFVTRAERALRRSARKVQRQNRKLGLPLILWKDGKVIEKPA